MKDLDSLSNNQLFQHFNSDIKKVSLNNKNNLPIHNISIQYDNNITILPQSKDTIFIIWHFDLKQEEQIKAWQLTNEQGLDILLPKYARSVFINISLLDKLTFSLYKISIDDHKELFIKYCNNNPLRFNNIDAFSKQEQDKLMINHFKQYDHSTQHFSSSNNFCK